MPDPLQGPAPSPIPFAAPNTVQTPQPTVASEVPPFPNQAPLQTPPQEPPKSKKNIIILVVAVLLLTSVLGIGVFYIYPKIKKPKTDAPAIQTTTKTSEQPIATPELQSSPSAQPKSSEPKFESSDFSIVGPATWTKITGSAGSIILFQNPATDTDANSLTFGASINVTTDFLANDMTLDEYAKGTNTQRLNTLAGYKPLSQTKGTMANQAANVDVYLAKIGNIDVKQGQIYTIKNHKAYVITFNAIANSWDKYAQIFNTTAQSFQFIGK
jgi:hypothetical protein